MVKFFVAVLVVMLVSFVSMGWRVGLVVAAAVPLTLAIVFFVMAATGKNFDRITLGSLILALGLLVDDAIIAIEMMVVKMEEGYDRIAASAYAWSHTAAPMLSGTLVTAVGFMPNGFARSSAGEYTANMFWIVGIALIASWVVAVVFTPYLGVKLLPDIPKVEGGHEAIYNTPRNNQFRAVLRRIIGRKKAVAGAVVGLFVLSVLGMGLVKKQFFPISDRPEVLVEVQMPYGSSISQTSAATAKVEAWLAQQKEARIVTAYVGQGAPRFFFSVGPELPDPSFAKIVIRTDNQDEREALKHRLRRAIADGLASEGRVRVTQLVFGPYSPFPVAYRVSGPDPAKLREIAAQVQDVMAASPMMRTVNTDWGTRTPTLHFTLQQDRLQAVGLTSTGVAQQLQFLLEGVPITSVREDIRSVQVVARSAGDLRLDPGRIADFTLAGAQGQRIPLSQVGTFEVRDEEPIMRRRDRVPTITVRGDIAEELAAARRLHRDYRATAADHGQATGRLSHRGGRFDRRVWQGDGGHGATVPDHARNHAADPDPAGALDLGNGDGDPHQPSRIDRGCADPSRVPAAFRHQCARRPRCAVRHSDAQHADPGWPDPSQPSSRPGPVPCRGGSHRATRPSGDPYRLGSGAGLHPAHPLGVLGHLGLHAHRRHARWHRAHAGVPACDVFDLVQDRAAGRSAAGRARRGARHSPPPAPAADGPAPPLPA
jgi:multidrug efflux pump subunit AcrB